MKKNRYLDGAFPSFLRCPVCGGELHAEDKSLFCARQPKPHCFDVASDGSVCLFPGKPAGGDDREMVRARTEFLSYGHYRPFADAVLALLAEYARGGVLVDAGCGEGYYTSLFSTVGGFDTVGFDLSRHAVSAASARAARENAFERLGYAVAGVNRLPVSDGSVDAITCLFAPCFENEYARALKEGGILLVAGAGPDHLWGLKEALYAEPRQNTVREDLPVRLTELTRKTVRYEITLTSPAEISSLFTMTPYSWRTGADDREKLLAKESLATVVEFDLHVYRK